MTDIGLHRTVSAHTPGVAAQVRNLDIDVLKGVAILMVVFGHVLRGLHETGIGLEPLFMAMDPRLYTIHVQILFVLSGILAYGSLVRNGAGSFVKSRFSAILLPLVLWTYLFVGIKVLAGPFQNQPADLSDLLILPFPGHLHLWFLWALFLIQLWAAAIWKIAALRSQSFRQGILIGAFVVSFALLLFNMGSIGTYWIGSARNNLPFFLLGLILAMTASVVMPRNEMKWIAVTVFFAVFANVPMLRSAVGGPPVSIVLCLSAVWAGRRLVLWNRLVPIFTKIGNGTMAIYLLHVIFAAAARELLIIVGITSTPLHILAGIAAGVALPLLMSTALPTRVNRALMIT